MWSSGWAELAPFQTDERRRTMKGVLRCLGREIVKVEAHQESLDSLTAVVESKSQASNRILKDVQRQIESCLRLDEDYSSFYEIIADEEEYRWIPESGAGRVFRSPTVFEDVVKTIMSTNCRWVQTKAMVKRLCSKVGKHYGGDLYSFPTPEGLLEAGEEFLVKEVRAGYRSRYLIDLTKRISSDQIEVEGWRHSRLSDEELAKDIRGLRGVGEWGTKNILQLVGRYSHLALDSWVRKQFYKIHTGGRVVPDSEVERHYERFGSWKGLVLWLDMVKEYLV